MAWKCPDPECEPTEDRPLVAVMVDQTFHGVLLFAVALVAGS